MIIRYLSHAVTELCRAISERSHIIKELDDAITELRGAITLLSRARKELRLPGNGILKCMKGIARRNYGTEPFMHVIEPFSNGTEQIKRYYQKNLMQA